LSCEPLCHILMGPRSCRLVVVSRAMEISSMVQPPLSLTNQYPVRISLTLPRPAGTVKESHPPSPALQSSGFWAVVSPAPHKSARHQQISFTFMAANYKKTRLPGHLVTLIPLHQPPTSQNQT